MRADRLVAAILHLQRHGRTTAAELARELEVSVPTARRDLAALSGAGVPVYPQPGRGGGWQLVGGARTDLSGLTAPEVRVLFLALGPALGAGGAATTTLAKLVRALPAPFRAEAEVALRSAVGDPVPWGGEPVPARERAPAPPGLADLAGLRDAVVGSRRVRLRYRSGEGRSSERVVEPWGLVDKAGTGYLVAGTARGARTYRLDRVEQADVLDDTFPRPADLDVEDVWRTRAREVEDRRTRVRATVRASQETVALLRRTLGAGVIEASDRPDGWSEAVVGAHTTRALAEQLAGWGSLVRVLDPPEVRAELRALAGELLAVHAEGTGPAEPTDPRS